MGSNADDMSQSTLLAKQPYHLKTVFDVFREITKAICTPKQKKILCKYLSFTGSLFETRLHVNKQTVALQGGMNKCAEFSGAEE